MTTATNKVARVAAAVAGLSLAALSIAPLAQAQTTTTTTTTTTASVTFTRNLTVGSTGADVTALQTWLIAKGFSIPAGATGYFGAQTKAALAAYQAANSISPAAGYFGPITRAAVAAAGGSTSTSTVPGCMPGAAFSSTTGQACGTTTTTGPLSGGEGSINNFKTVGASNTSLNQADSDQVLGFEFKAVGSDLQVNRVDFDVYNSNNVGTIRPWGVFQTATLMDGNTTIGTVDASNQANWSQDGTASNGNQIYRVRFDGLNDVVKNGNTADFYLTLTTQNAISNTNTGGQYTVTLPNQGLRAVDAKGIQQYTTSTVNTTVSVSNSTNGSVVLSTGSDNPQTTTVQGDSNVSTSGITLNTFTLQAKDADLVLYSLPVRVATTTSTASNQIRTLKLYQGSTLLDTESIASNVVAPGGVATTTFQNLNFKISQGSTVPFKIVAEINKIDGTNFAEGAGVTVSVPGYGIDIENGSNVVSVTGAATGNPISFRSIGLSADGTPSVASGVATNNGGNVTTQTGTFTFTFNVTAFGQDIYVASTSAAFSASLFSGNQAASSTITASAITSTADRDATTQNYVIHSGQTRQITITVSRNGGNNTFYYAKLNSLNFDTTNVAVPTGRSITLPTAYTTNQVIINS
jgi:peptidoglycan hydrolase-like protein with peptidoglycan-binding domain